MVSVRWTMQSAVGDKYAIFKHFRKQKTIVLYQGFGSNCLETYTTVYIFYCIFCFYVSRLFHLTVSFSRVKTR